ncbi:PREDICTED: uncharacterized protein LOC109584254 [Amphimedon queenslandica]|uniref:Uncharacterized protein n=2 Tax=Amphimedon queenslandica TaxID=400682 RepID=A0AAN0JFD5_AMPQE|nr:PREDICTED: uncharacterized protein LOC109584254 [Amphimedon queenslandica]|eukprot:XP_019855497.1 PREDICTED: uncharacterized protein LOC109584254 [Amphimedon queenslandica]
MEFLLIVGKILFCERFGMGNDLQNSAGFGIQIEHGCFKLGVNSGSIVSSDVVSSLPDSNIQGFKRVHCPMCHSTCDYFLEFAKGDPRNIALIGQWDGWQPFSTLCKHSCGSIEVQVATMSKEDRSKIEEVYVCGFVP